MKKGFFLIICFSFVLSTKLSYATQLLSVDFTQQDETSILEMVFDRPDVLANKYHIKDDKQIIVDLKGVKANKQVMRDFDTSEFDGSTVFVSLYKRIDNPKDLRIAIQLRDNVRSILQKDKNKIVLKIENRFGVFFQEKKEDNKTFAEKVQAVDSERLLVPKSGTIDDILANVILSGKKKYVGKKITFKVKDMAPADMLNMIADYSGFNIILPDSIKSLPSMSLHLINIPWDQVLDTILNMHKLVGEKNGNILVITTLEKVTRERELELKAIQMAKAEVPLVTKVFPVSYASIGDLSDVVKQYLTKRGSISLDKRTNMLIVKDIVDSVEKVKKIIETLDTQTPQVLIESKIVEVQESYSKEIGLRRGVQFGYDPIGGGDNIGIGVGSSKFKGILGAAAISGDQGPGFSFSSAPSADITMFGLQVARFKRLVGLDFTLQMMESESKAKIVASPKVITQNMKEATLSAEDTKSFLVQDVDKDGNATTDFKEVKASLTLKVTPQVTNEGSIVLSIDLGKEQFGKRPEGLPYGPPEMSGRAIKTNVLVDNGSTIVIGGIYNFVKVESHSGVPFLKDIPLVGWLFRTPYAPSITKNELVIFLTPRVINQEEAGLGT